MINLDIHSTTIRLIGSRAASKLSLLSTSERAPFKTPEESRSICLAGASAFIATSGWLYAVAVKVTTVSKQISAIQTLAVSGSQETVLSLTLSDGSHVQYVIKAPAARQINVAGKKEGAKKSVQKWELASLATAFNVGDASLPLGIALNMAN